MGESLAKGAALTAETWADFVARLHHDCVGEGVKRHYTADATFLVEKRVWQAVPEELSDIRRMLTDGHEETPEAFFEDLDAEEQAALNEAAGGSFLDADGYDMRAATGKACTRIRRCISWKNSGNYVGQHMTRDAADAFIKRKGHDYREGLRVYVDATSYSWELNTIKAAILDGRIGFIPKDTP